MKKCWQHFRKMLTKNIGTASKNVDEKMFVPPPKIVDEKNVVNTSKKC
jgi:hypothetical protein